jgi:predicted RNA binding protein YcfA (HicA-like mRNA interferase family)
MPKLPILSGNELINALAIAGFQKIKQRGSHVSMQKGEYKTVVPLHHELAKGTLLGILKQCGLTKDELVSLLRK